MALESKFSFLYETYKYFVKKVKPGTGNDIIRSFIMQKCSILSSRIDKQLPKWLFNDSVMCPYCFTFWGEGKFSIRLKTRKGFKKNKKDSKRNKQKEKNAVLKCLMCNKSRIIRLNKDASSANTSSNSLTQDTRNQRKGDNQKTEHNRTVQYNKSVQCHNSNKVIKSKNLNVLNKNSFSSKKTDLKTNSVKGKKGQTNFKHKTSVKSKSKKSYLTLMNDIL